MSTPPPDRGPAVARGRILCYRLLDIGRDVSLAHAERLLAAAQGGDRPSQVRPPPRRRAGALDLPALPLHLPLGHRAVKIAGMPEPLEGDAAVRLYDMGTVSLVVDLPIPPGTSLDALRPLCAELYESPALSDIARQETDKVVPRISPAVHGPHAWRDVETYTVVYVEQLEGGARAADVLAWPGLPKLLLGEEGGARLAERQRGDVLAQADGYLEDDLVVVDWNSAFVVEPSGSLDIPEILEYATSLLLQLRYHDEELDAQLARVHAELARPRGSLAGLLHSPHGKLAHEVFRQLVEVAQLTERIGNALKVLGDFYHARVFRTAVDRFRIPTLQQTVSDKQALLSSVVQMLRSEVESHRSLVIEIAIVLLIIVEVVQGFRGH